MRIAFAGVDVGRCGRPWKYVSVRRLFIFLERSIEEGMQGAVFEPNDVTQDDILNGRLICEISSSS